MIGLQDESWFSMPNLGHAHVSIRIAGAAVEGLENG